MNQRSGEIRRQDKNEHPISLKRRAHKHNRPHGGTNMQFNAKAGCLRIRESRNTVKWKHIKKTALRYLLEKNNHPPIVIISLKQENPITIQMEPEQTLKEWANRLFLEGAAFAAHYPTTPIRQIWFVYQTQLEPVGEILHIIAIKWKTFQMKNKVIAIHRDRQQQIQTLHALDVSPPTSAQLLFFLAGYATHRPTSEKKLEQLDQEVFRATCLLTEFSYE
jgi:hypothetical protein